MLTRLALTCVAGEVSQAERTRTIRRPHGFLPRVFAICHVVADRVGPLTQSMVPTGLLIQIEQVRTLLLRISHKHKLVSIRL